MPPTTKCVTAHVGARDQYQLSLALRQAGLLEQLVTEAYTPDWLHRIAPDIASKRYCAGLSLSSVTISARALSLMVAARIDRKTDLHHVDQAISRAAYNVAVKAQANLFLYSYYAHSAFQQAIFDKSPVQRILFQLHPHPYNIRQLLEEEMERVPFAAQSIRDEDEFRLRPAQLESLAVEPSMATLCVTASRFTQETLLQQGIPATRIRVVPYGVDSTRFPARLQPPTSDAFRVIFVGRMNQRKGLADLLEAVRQLQFKKVEVVLCGRGYVDKNILKAYRDLTIRLHWAVSADQLLRELHQSHVFVLPSLAEGFGHVILEAMAAGLPIITTANTGAPDVLDDGVHGAIVPIRNPQRIAEQLEAAMCRPDEWFEMGQAAARQARLFTWERFRAGIVSVYREEMANQLTCES
ncbi:glycosyltransferase family 4 protein [Spirosoma soli]|uniref:Glycosyltransferase family 4 protein n=1 Tax=Spirosoma soli TaxID=1770529 RepID=A0ABW5M8Z9_9BACT